MTKQMLIDALHSEETRVVIADDDFIEDFDFVTSAKKQIKGNIYLAKITRVEPSLQAAFVEYGGGKQGFLPFSEIHPDYYQIPEDDKKNLIEEQERALAREEDDDDDDDNDNESTESGEGGEGRDRNRGGNNRSRRRRGGKYGRDRNRRPREGGEGVEGQAEGGESNTDSGHDAHDHHDRDGNTKNDDTDYQAARSKKFVTASEPVAEDEAVDVEVESLGVPEEQAENHEESTGDTIVIEVSESSHSRARDDEEEDEENIVETVNSDEVDEGRQRRKTSSFKRYRIQEVIKRNQIVLVQVIKEERGNKGVSLTTYISLAGRYCVLMPNSPKGGGVSRKIGNGEQRKKLKEIVAELRDSRGLSAIIRTAGLDRTKVEIKRDYEYLVKLWQEIREDTMKSNAPALIYEESDIIRRAIRDLYTNDVEQILVQGEQAYKDAKAFMKLIMPSHAPRIKQHKENQPIFSTYGIEEQLATMHEPTARLPSGGYIVLQATEALISIDVNSGRSTTERNVEETAIKTNLEAAKEVARQLRLRDLAGLIVIDFIDMYYGKNKRNLERAMKDALKVDRAKIQVGRISPFGLMELSRQRMRPSIAESSTIVCMHCEGTGTIRSVETQAIQIVRLLESEASSAEYTHLRVSTNAEVVLHLFNVKRHLIQHIETHYNVVVVIDIDTVLAAGRFRLVKVTSDGREIMHQQDPDRDGKRRGSGKRNRRGGRNRNGSDRDSFQNGIPGDQSLDQGDDNAENDEPETNEEGESQHRYGRNRDQRPQGRRAPLNPATQDEEAPAGEVSAEGAPQRERSEQRRSRGGRRRRGGADRPDRAPRDMSQTASVEVSAESISGTVSYQPKTESFAPESAPKHVPDFSRQTPDVVASAAPPSDDAQAEKPKRKGWWNL